LDCNERQLLGVHRVAVILLGGSVGDDPGYITTLMGTTPKPLKLLVDTTLYAKDEILALIEQGHDIRPLPTEWAEYHLLGPTCWRTLDLEYLDVTLAAIRKEVYEVRTPKPGSDDPKRPARARKSRARKPARSCPDVVKPSGTVGE